MNMIYGFIFEINCA